MIGARFPRKGWWELWQPAQRVLRAGTFCAYGCLALGLVANLTGIAFNRTASIPRGWYRTRPISGAPEKGDLVAVQVPAAVRALALERGYVTERDELFKYVLAVPGDHVCLAHHSFSVNGTAVGQVLATDRLGRPLPSWSFCGWVPPNTFWLGTHYPRSFDSRYFGPVNQDQIATRLEPLWTF